MYKNRWENPEWLELVAEFQKIKSVRDKIAWLESNRKYLETTWDSKVDNLIKGWSKKL